MVNRRMCFRRLGHFVAGVLGIFYFGVDRIGFYSKIDLGIAKYHFELGAGAENFSWNVSASQNSVLDNRKGPAKAGPLGYSCSKQLRM